MRYALPGITLLIGLSIGQTHAQFPSFPDSNALWVMDVYDGPQFQGSYSYHMRAANHDTLIDGNWYSTIWVGSFNETDVYCGGIREDIDSRVYLYPAGGNTEYLLYDLDPMEGDTLFVWLGDPLGLMGDPSLQMMHVVTVETFENLNGTAWKLIGIMSDAALIGGQGVTQYWIQGVGGSGGLFSTLGSLTVSLTESLACMQANDTIWPPGEPGVCSFTGMNEVISRSFVIRPNPNNGRFTVEFTDPLLAESYYSVYDAMGRLLLQRRLPTGATLEEVDLSRFGQGTYVIKVTDPEGVRHERVTCSP